MWPVHCLNQNLCFAPSHFETSNTNFSTVWTTKTIGEIGRIASQPRSTYTKYPLFPKHFWWQFLSFRGKKTDATNIHPIFFFSFFPASKLCIVSNSQPIPRLTSQKILGHGLSHNSSPRGCPRTSCPGSSRKTAIPGRPERQARQDEKEGEEGQCQ